MPKEIKVSINQDGTTQTDFSGFQGPGCLEEAERLQKLLALYGIHGQQTGFEPKPELTHSLDETTLNRLRGEVKQ